MKHDLIEVNPDVMFGKPVIRGTRLTTEMIVRELADGMSIEEMLSEHPRLTVEGVEAAKIFAEKYMTRSAA